MSPYGDYLPRRAAQLVSEALVDTRVVVVNGARQVGKSTLANTVLRQIPKGIARYLDNPVTRVAAQEDPVAFIRHDGLMLIDEVQRVPDLWLAIKEIVDRQPRPGRFLLMIDTEGMAYPLALARNGDRHQQCFKAPRERRTTPHRSRTVGCHRADIPQTRWGDDHTRTDPSPTPQDCP
jgi:hypothetical protein